MSSGRLAMFVAVVALLGSASYPLRARAGAPPSATGKLLSVDPLQASPGQDIHITGTGFHPAAQHNEVFFIPPDGGLPVSARATLIDREQNEPNGPTRMKVHPGIRRLTVRVPPGARPGVNALRVVDVIHDIVSEGLAIEIGTGAPVNTAPSVNAGPDQTITLPAMATLNGLVSDDGLPLGSTVHVTWSKVSGPGSVTFAQTTAAATAAAFSTAGDYVLRLTATDGALTSTDEMNVAVSAAPPINTAPNVNAGPDQSITLPAMATLAGLVSDDGLPTGSTVHVTWSAVSGPGTVAFADATSASTIAQFSVAGDYVLRLTATDGALTNADDMAIAVKPALIPNAPPTVDAGPDKTATLPNASLALEGTATDDGNPAGSTLTVSWSMATGPAPVTFANASSAATSATFTVAGDYVVRLAATDGELTATDDVAVTINGAEPVNAAPLVNAGADQEITLPATASLAGTATDDGRPVGSTLTTTWRVLSGGAVTFGNAAATTTTAAFAAPGTYILRLSATDGSLTGADDVTIVVHPAAATNKAPSVNAGTDQSITQPQDVVQLAGTATDDGLPKGSNVSVTWTAESGPAPVTFANAASKSTSASLTVAGVYVLKLTASDGELSASDSVAITVVPPVAVNLPPSVNAGADGVITFPGNTFPLSGSATDDGLPSLPGLSVRWNTASGPKPVSFANEASATTVVTFTAAGTYVLRLTATDGAFSVSDETTIVVNPGTPPPVENRAPIAHAGGPYTGDAKSPVAFSGTQSSDPDGDPITYAWDFGDGGKGTGASAQHTYVNAGTYTVTLTVSDDHGHSHSASAQVTIGPAADRAPPSVTLIAPHEALPGAAVSVTANVFDNVGVALVQFFVDAQPASTDSTEPYQHALTVPALTTPGTVIKVKALATDTSGNTGSSEVSVVITATPDSTPPTVTVTAPPTAAPGSTVMVSAIAADATGVTSVAFTRDGQPIALDPLPPYSATFVVPTDAVPGTLIVVGARASDAAGNVGDASASVSVAADADTTPPVVDVTAPPSAELLSSIEIAAAASDNVAVSQVRLFVDGVAIGTFVAPPYSAHYTLPPNRVAGSVLSVRAEATDTAGLTASDVTTTIVTGAAGSGAILGEVYDDSTGLPLSGAVVAIVPLDDEAASPVMAKSGVRGAYTADAAGGVRIRISKPGFTTVERTVAVPDSAAGQPIDARLTPLSSATFAVARAAGREMTSDAASLAVPPGSLDGDVTITLTRITQQGLRALLPAGWSPVAAVDIAPEGHALSTGATLTMTNALGAPAGSQLTLATWDVNAGAWRAVAATTVTPGQPLEASINVTGQYAWLLRDQLPSSPPAPAIGDVLAGTTAIETLPQAATLVITPQPKIAVYSPGVRSDVSAELTLPAAAASGIVVRAAVTEAYQFATTPAASIDPFIADLVLYQFPGTATGLRGSWIASPSLTFEAANLLKGVIALEISHSGAGSNVVPVVGPSGGTVTSVTGERLTLPAGAVSGATPITISRITPENTGVALGATLDFIGAAHVMIPGSTLNAPATLSVPRPPSLVDDAGIFLLRLVDLGGSTYPVFAGVGRIAGDLVVSAIDVPGLATAVEGVRGSGRYVFAKSKVAFGFGVGTVQRAIAPAPGALVTSSTWPMASIARADGGYTLPLASGNVELSAIDLATTDRVTIVSSVAPGAIVARTLLLQVQPPRILSVMPTDGATNVPLGTAVVVTVSEPVNPQTVDGSIRLETSSGAPVASSRTLSNGGRVITLRANNALSPDSVYVVRATTALVDLSGNPLAATFVSTFTSLDTTAPPLPPAGSISATLPSGGFSTVSGTQGAAGLHDTVRIVNLTKGTFVPALVNPNGGFSAQIAATLADKLMVSIVDQNGNETAVPVPPFSQTNADGSKTSVVGAQGGRIEGPGGIAVDVPEQALPDGTPITILPVSEAAFPVQLTPAQKQGFAFSGGVKLDFGGSRPASYVDLSIPAGPGDKRSDQWIVVAIEQINGRPVMSAVDTASIVDGRITTASPPCPGVLAAQTYGFIKSTKQPVGLIYSDPRPLINTQLTFFQMVQEGGLSPGAADAIPWGVTSASLFPQPHCFPILTGRATVTPNSQRIVVEAKEFTPADQILVVRNVTLGTELRYPRTVVEYRFPVNGTADDSFIVQAIAGGNPINVPFDQAPFSPGRVLIRVDMDKVTTQVTEVVVRNISKSPVEESHFPQSNAAATVRMTGGGSDAYEVTVLNAANISRAVSFSIESPTGAGNLVARVLPGTIDPGNTVTLVNRATNAETPIPQHLYLPTGGFEFPFDGNVSDLYKLVVKDAGQTEVDHVYMPAVRILITNPETGRVVREVVVPAPPIDDPFFNLGVLSDDAVAPMLIGSPNGLTSFDPNGVLSFTFSEGIDRESALNGVQLKEEGGSVVAGEVRLSAQNTVVTFVPSAALKLGKKYTLTLSGVRDGSGNTLATTTLEIKTFEPKKSFTADAPFGLTGYFREIVFLNRDLGNGETLRRAYAVVNDIEKSSLAVLDMTKPGEPKILSSQVGGNGNIAIVTGVKDLKLRDVTSCGSGPLYSGDILITTNNNNGNVALQFWDLTNADAPCMMGSKLIVVNPALGPVKGAVDGMGLARGLTGVIANGRVFAFAAVGNMGLFQVDVGLHCPRRDPVDQGREPLVSGNYDDVLEIRGPLLAATERTAYQLDIYDPSLGLINSVSLGPSGNEATQMAYAENFGIDNDANGIIDAQERHDIVFIGGTAGVIAVDVTNPDQPYVLGTVAMPGFAYEVQVDPTRRRLFVFGTQNKQSANGKTLFIVDLSAPDPFVSLDTNNDGLDDRIIWQTVPGTYPDNGIGAQRSLTLDSERGIVYLSQSGTIGTQSKLDVWSVYNLCCDLGIAMQRELDLPDTSDPETALKREKKALQKGIAAGLAAAASCGVPVRAPGSAPNPNALSLLEQGSGACIWKDNIVEACRDYQPGVSDHDYEVFIPAAHHPGSDTSGAKCVTQKLVEQFKTPDGAPKPIDLGDGVTVSFNDITFYAVRREPFEQAKLDVLPSGSSGDDPGGDLGLGRQQLLLKWLLEGEYVALTPYDVTGKPLDDILTRLREVTHVPVLEGYEWGVLQRYALTKSKAFLRVRGASDSLSAFYPLFVAQLHDAGKAGIRAALARMMADPQAAALALDVTRGDYASQSCYSIPIGSSKEQWLTLPRIGCKGFEQYIASAAARSVLENLTVFTELDVSTLIQRFYEVKADQGQRITSEPKADQFIVSVAKFVDRVVNETQAAYDATLPADPDAGQRTANMGVAQSATAFVLKNAKLHVVPQVFNFSFTGADEVLFAMYRGTPSSAIADEIKKVRVTLQPNELRSLRTAADTKLPEPADGVTAEDRNLLDISKVSSSDLNPLFMLGEKGSAKNPPIDLTQNIGLNRYVAFTVDLPERKFKEAFRDNNVGGFFYYVLDRVNGVSDQPPPKIPLPIEDEDGKLLEPDPECTISADLQISQAVLIDNIDDPADPLAISDFITVEPNETVQIRLRVKNDAGFGLEHVKACSSLKTSDPCFDAGTLAVGEQKDITFPWTAPSESQFIEAIATANAAGVGTRRSPSMGIAVGCEQYLVVPAPNFDSPMLGTKYAQVMRGGEAVRHYRVVDKNTGLPVSGIVVEVEVQATGKPNEIRSYVSDIDGNLSSNGEGAVIVPVPAAVHEAGHTIKGRITKVQAQPAYCQANLTLFEIDVVDRSFTRNYNAGANIEVKGAVSKGLSGKSGLGFGVSISEIAGKGPQSLALNRQIGSGVGVVAEVVGLELGVFLGGKAKLSGKVEAGASAAMSHGDSHALPYNQVTKQLDQQERAVFGALFLATTSLGGADPFTRKLLDSAIGLVDPQPYQVSTTDAVSAEVAGSASFEGTLGLGAKDKAKSIQLGLEASIGAELKFGVGIALTDNTKAGEYIPAVDVKGGLDVSAQLGVAKPGDSETTKQKKKGLADKWKIGMKGTVMATMKVAVSLDRTDLSKVKKLTLSFSNPKKFGFRADAEGFTPIGIGFGDKQGISFSVTNEQHIKAMAAQLAVVRQAASPFLADLPDGSIPVVNDSGVLAEIEKLIDMLVKSDADYVITEELGQAVSLPVGFDITLGPATLAIKGVPALDTSIGYLLESGVVKNGQLYSLARYTNDTLLPDFSDSGADFLALANLSFDGLGALATTAFDHVIGAFGTGPQSLKSNFTAELTYNGTGETPFTPSISSWHFEPDSTPTPSGHRIYQPSDFRAPPNLPHYGIGHFHQFAPTTKVLANPATMTIFYQDAEVAGFDESTLGVYRWSTTTNDWDYVGGTPDPANNKVTAPIDRLGLYTAAPPMPAGTIVLTAKSGVAGPGGVTIDYSASALRLNTGAPVPNGTLYTVMASTPGLNFTPVGTVLSSDADPQTPGVQVAAANGAINFSIKYDAVGEAMVVVFSREGTALATQVLPAGGNQ